MLFFENLAMESLETPAPPHAHLGTVRGADRTRTQSFLLKIVRAPGAAARLFGYMSLQNWTVLARVSAPPVIQTP